MRLMISMGRKRGQLPHTVRMGSITQKWLVNSKMSTGSVKRVCAYGSAQGATVGGRGGRTAFCRAQWKNVACVRVVVQNHALAEAF